MELMTFIRNQRDRVTSWALIGCGLVALIIGYLGVSGTPYPAEQIPYVVSGGLGGLYLLGLGAVVWLSADLRDEWRKLDAIEEILRAGADEAVPIESPSSTAASPVPRAAAGGASPSRQRPLMAGEAQRR